MDYEKKYKEALLKARAARQNTESAVTIGILEEIFPELRESEDERIRKELITFVKGSIQDEESEQRKAYLAWLEKQGEKESITIDADPVASYYDNVMISDTKNNKKQGEQKSTQEIEPFEAEHGKYYYCIKDYFCGGRKQASKGDVVQALRGLPIMGLKDASGYFLPVNSVKCNSAWSDEDDIGLDDALWCCKQAASIAKDENDMGNTWYAEKWLKSLKQRMGE